MNIDTGDTAWILVSAALVMLMTPGLAFFYGGMVRAKSVLNMMMMSIGTMGTVGVLWILVGYGEAFGDSWRGLIGIPFADIGLARMMGPDVVTGSVPALAFAAFQAMFAIIATALVSGAIADRAKFSTWLPGLVGITPRPPTRSSPTAASAPPAVVDWVRRSPCSSRRRSVTEFFTTNRLRSEGQRPAGVPRGAPAVPSPRAQFWL